MTTVDQIMQSPNAAIPESNIDAVLLFFLIQCLIDTNLDISQSVVYEKLPQAPRRCTHMLVEIDYILQSNASNTHVEDNFLLSSIIWRSDIFSHRFTNNSVRSTVYMLPQQLN